MPERESVRFPRADVRFQVSPRRKIRGALSSKLRSVFAGRRIRLGMVQFFDVTSGEGPDLTDTYIHTYTYIYIYTGAPVSDCRARFRTTVNLAGKFRRAVRRSTDFSDIRRSEALNRGMSRLPARSFFFRDSGSEVHGARIRTRVIGVHSHTCALAR